MKLKFTIIAALLLFLASCRSAESPESVADKALTEISNELLSGKPCSREYISPDLIYSDMAKAVIEGNEIPSFDKYFATDKPFSRWDLVETIEGRPIELYKLWDITGDVGATIRDGLLDIYKNEGGVSGDKKLLKITDRFAITLEYKNVPIYKVKYKIDSRHIDFVGDEYSTAIVGVIKHPEDGYKVVSFMWEE